MPSTLDPNSLRLILFLGGLVSMASVESLWTARPWLHSRLRRWFLHSFLAVLNTCVVRLIVAVPLLWWAQMVRQEGWGLASGLGISGLPEILVSLVVLDFFDYWWHRWNHMVPFFWRFHKVHHQDTHLDVSTSLRFHVGELLISGVVKAGWILVLGPSLWAFALFEMATSLASQFHHANIVFPARVEHCLRKILVTPYFHASHHTVARTTGDANYSTIFILWDHLCGSYRTPPRQELGALGLPQGREQDLSLGAALKGPWLPENGLQALVQEREAPGQG